MALGLVEFLAADRGTNPFRRIVHGRLKPSLLFQCGLAFAIRLGLGLFALPFLVAFLFLPFPILLALERADPGGFGGRETLTDRGIALLV